jgi:hypothetical protein
LQIGKGYDITLLASGHIEKERRLMLPNSSEEVQVRNDILPVATAVDHLSHHAFKIANK